MGKLKFSYTGQEIYDRAVRTFGDEYSVQVTEADIVRWINDAQRTAIEHNPVLLEKATTSIVAEQATYPFDAANVHFVQALHFDGRPLKPLSFQEAQQWIMENNVSDETGDPVLWYEFDGDYTLWPTPKESLADGLVLYYSKYPEDLTQLSDPLGLPDTYFNVIFGLVMKEAYTLDENWTGFQAFKGDAIEGLNRLSLNERRTQTNLYPFINVDPEDM